MVSQRLYYGRTYQRQKFLKAYRILNPGKCVPPSYGLIGRTPPGFKRLQNGRDHVWKDKHTNGFTFYEVDVTEEVMGQVEDCCKIYKAFRQSSGSPFKCSTVPLRNFDSFFSEHLSKGCESRCDFISHVKKEWLMKVRKSLYLFSSGTCESMDLYCYFFTQSWSHKALFVRIYEETTPSLSSEDGLNSVLNWNPERAWHEDGGQVWNEVKAVFNSAILTINISKEIVRLDHAGCILVLVMKNHLISIKWRDTEDSVETKWTFQHELKAFVWILMSAFLGEATLKLESKKMLWNPILYLAVEFLINQVHGFKWASHGMSRDGKQLSLYQGSISYGSLAAELLE